ncbi:hypothetical protein EDC96DRAFT_583043 [Choanephora cucurbitarum]|nr:hypothetical protein EDC96DRAFT_583043 [Choanephora cucurbitarum]
MSRTQVRKHVYVKPTIKVVKNLSCHGLQASFQVSTSRSPFTVIKTGLLQERCGVQQVLMLRYQAQTQAKHFNNQSKNVCHKKKKEEILSALASGQLSNKASKPKPTCLPLASHAPSPQEANKREGCNLKTLGSCIHILLFLTGLASLLVWYHYTLFLCCLGLPGLTQWSSSEAYFL